MFLNWKTYFGICLLTIVKKNLGVCLFPCKGPTVFYQQTLRLFFPQKSPRLSCVLLFQIESHVFGCNSKNELKGKYWRFWKVNKGNKNVWIEIIKATFHHMWYDQHMKWHTKSLFSPHLFIPRVQLKHFFPVVCFFIAQLGVQMFFDHQKILICLINSTTTTKQNCTIHLLFLRL